jgi:hypothetical protein
MLPLKISSFLERPPLPQGQVTPMRQRSNASEAPTVAPVQAAAPAYDRRVNASRRVGDRRESEAPAFLDTRVSQGRRRSVGRRAEDQAAPGLRKPISIKA